MAIGRRTVLIGVLSGAAGLTGLGRAARAFASEAQGLSLYHLHTDETLRVVYREHAARIEQAGEALSVTKENELFAQDRHALRQITQRFR